MNPTHVLIAEMRNEAARIRREAEEKATLIERRANEMARADLMRQIGVVVR